MTSIYFLRLFSQIVVAIYQQPEYLFSLLIKQQSFRKQPILILLALFPICDYVYIS
jgi:hypothetical protein